MVFETENYKSLIEQVVISFYSKAVNDIFIGYHFRKLIPDKRDQVIIYENLGHFSGHIPKIVDFWSEQLLNDYKSTRDKENLLKSHETLNIRKGELGRWLVLFRKTLQEELSDKDFIDHWNKKVDQFELAFNRYFFSHT